MQVATCNEQVSSLFIFDEYDPIKTEISRFGRYTVNAVVEIDLSLWTVGNRPFLIKIRISSIHSLHSQNIEDETKLRLSSYLITPIDIPVMTFKHDQ